MNVSGEDTDLEEGMATLLAHLKSPSAPDTTIVTGPGGVVAPAIHTFTYFSQSRFATYECRLDGPILGQWAPCGHQTQAFEVLAPGDYVFRVRGTDETGATDPTPAYRFFSVREPLTGPGGHRWSRSR